MRTFVITTFVFIALISGTSSVRAASQSSVIDTSGQQQSVVDTTSDSGTNVTLINPLKGVDCSRGNGDCLSSFLLSILDFVINIGSIVVILMLVFVGFKFVVAQGNDSKISEARTMLLWTVIGALVLLGSKAIALGVKATITALGG